MVIATPCGIAIAVRGDAEEEVLMARGRIFNTEGGFLATLVKPRALEAEELLMLAVLEQAVADLNDSAPEVRADADAYIFADRIEQSIFSFDAVCAYFKLSPQAVRQALRARRAQKVSLRLMTLQTAA
jgi:hypothetical protein